MPDKGFSPSIRIRASIGTLARAKVLRNLRTEEHPRTAYLLLNGGCIGKCAFCPQWLNSERIARVSWPEVEIEKILNSQWSFERVCVQSVLRRMFWRELVEIASLFEIPVSLATNPVGERELLELRKYSQMIGVGLDAMSISLFEEVGKPGSFDSYLKFLEKSIKVYGRGNVHVHLIAGLGEEIREALKTISLVFEMGGDVALFAFTPVPGTPYQDRERPPIEYYRFLQIAVHFIRNGIPLKRATYMDPDEYKEAFLTSGCPGCNRPFYNESPSGEYYNFPSFGLLERNWEKVRKEVERALDYIRLLP